MWTFHGVALFFRLHHHRAILGERYMPECIPVEPIPLATIPVDGIHRIEIKGDQALFVLYEEQKSEFDDSRERRLVAKLLVPISSIPECVRQALEATAAHAAGQVKRVVSAALMMH